MNETTAEKIQPVEAKKQEIKAILESNTESLSYDDLKSIRAKLNRIDLLYKNRGHLQKQDVGVTALHIDRVLGDEESYDPQKAAQLVPKLFAENFPLS